MEEKEIFQLISEVRRGNDGAFSDLVKRYTPLMNKEISEFMTSSISFDEMFSEACIALHSAAMRYDILQTTVTFGLFAKICIHRRLIDLSKALVPKETVIDVDKVSVTYPIDTRLAEAERFDSIMCVSKTLLSDFEYEVQMALVNRKLNPNLETMFLASSEKYTYLSSTIVKEMARYGANLAEFIPREIVDEVKTYLSSLNHFEHIDVTRAGGVISSHCGPGTLGILFYGK